MSWASCHASSTCSYVLWASTACHESLLRSLPFVTRNDLSLVSLRVVRLFYVPGASTACRELVLRVVALVTLDEHLCRVACLYNAL
jgi:hypothetical protein